MKEETGITIEIDLEAYKLIEGQRQTFKESQNNIIKRIFEKYLDLSSGKLSKAIDRKVSYQKNDVKYSNKGLYTRTGDYLPEGLKLRRFFKGALYEAVVEDGFIIFNKEKYESPSSAAIAVTNTSVNGWSFWEYFDEEKETYKSLQYLRFKEELPSSSNKRFNGGVLTAVKKLLQETGKPMHYKEITDEIIKRGFWQSSGKTPENTVNAQLSIDIKEKKENSQFLRIKPGYFCLRDSKEGSLFSELAKEL